MSPRSRDRLRRLGNSLALYARWFALECRARLAPERHRATPDNRHALLLVDQFPPSESGGVYRPLSFARYAADSGWSITVLVSGAPDIHGTLGEALRRQLPSSVQVRQLDLVEPPLLWRLGPSLDGGLSRAIQLVRRTLPHMTDRTDVIIASGPTFHVFVAGMFLKKLTGVRLILDYRDEWSECPFHFVETGRLDRWWERRCLRASDSTLFATASMLEHSARTFPEAPRHSTVIPNGFDFALLDDRGPARPVEQPPAWRPGRITFVGSLGPHNEPASFLHALETVLKRRPDLVTALEICWIGHRSGEKAAQLEQFPCAGTFRIMPAVTPADAVRWMEQSAMVLLIANPRWARYRQGKLYSYLASSAPILAYAVTGEMAEVITSLEAGIIVADSDDRALEAALDGAVRQPEVHPRNTKRDTWIRRHDRRLLTGQLYAHIDQVLAEGRDTA